MATRKRAKIAYNNPFEDIRHQFEDVRSDLRGVKKDIVDIKGMLGKHRKEEKDNGKRIDALTKRMQVLPELTKRVEALPTLTRRVTDLTKRVTDQGQRIDSLTKRMTDHGERIDSLTKEVKAMPNQIVGRIVRELKGPESAK